MRPPAPAKTFPSMSSALKGIIDRITSACKVLIDGEDGYHLWLLSVLHKKCDQLQESERYNTELVIAMAKMSARHAREMESGTIERCPVLTGKPVTITPAFRIIRDEA